MITTDEAIALMQLIKGDDSDATTKAIRTALSTAIDVVVAEGGDGWDWQEDEVTFTLTAGTDTYYINKKDRYASGTVTIQGTVGCRPIGIIKDVWYSTSRVIPLRRGEFYDIYQGQTGTGTPDHWTAFGNRMLLGPIPTASSLTMVITELPQSIEDIPEDKQHAVIFTAIALMFPPTRDYVKARDDMNVAIKTLRASDGVMDFSERISGDFG